MLRSYHRKWRREWGQIFFLGRMFLLLVLGSMMFVVVVGLGSMTENKRTSSSLSSMKQMVKKLSTHFFINIIALEVPNFSLGSGHALFTRSQFTQFFIRLAMNVNPLDMKTLLASEVPSMNHYMSDQFQWQAENRNRKKLMQRNQKYVSEPNSNNKVVQVNKQIDFQKKSFSQQANLQPVVFIYHSHNRESWNPVLNKKISNPNNEKQNITLVGRRLQKKLAQRGIGATHSNQDYATTVPDYNWSMSYKYSKQTVKQAMHLNQHLQFFFDVHRDSTTRKHSTVTINGTPYAQVYFIIGRRNVNWKHNEKFAHEIHNKLESNYPGISRGILGKNAKQGHGEYNQSLSTNSVILEIGGVDNTLEEVYRTADVLATLIADVIFDRTHKQI